MRSRLRLGCKAAKRTGVGQTPLCDIGAQGVDLQTQIPSLLPLLFEFLILRVAPRAVVAALRLPDGIGNARVVVVDEGGGDTGFTGDGGDAQPASLGVREQTWPFTGVSWCGLKSHLR